MSLGLGVATFASLLHMAPETRVAMLLAIPTAVWCLARAAAQHAKAKEDHLRRIDEIERHVNRLAGQELLVFQSRHGSRGTHTGGRTSRSALTAITLGALTTLFLSVFLFLQSNSQFPTLVYSGFVALVGIDIVFMPFSLKKYQYDRGRLIHQNATHDTHSV